MAFRNIPKQLSFLERRSAVRDASPHFKVFPEFQGAGYLDRYNILCRKLVQERLYTTATVIASPRTAAETGEYAELSELTGLETFVTSFAGHIAAEAARAPTGTPNRLL
jgi:hypothetical protein